LLSAPLQTASFIPFIVGLAGLEFAFQRFRLNAKGWSEFLAFLLTGPLLAVGFSWAIIGSAGWAEAAMGSIFGAIALMYFHSANFENIMPDDQSGVRTWATKAGFDASKKFFTFTAVLTISATTAYIVLFARDFKLVAVLLAQLLFLIPVNQRVSRLSSPLSSDLVGLRMEAVRLCWLTVIAMAGGFFWIYTALRLPGASV
jgi:1,4-dihydroxy-2-naphthoate octaprenyltransferase